MAVCTPQASQAISQLRVKRLGQVTVVSAVQANKRYPLARYGAPAAVVLGVLMYVLAPSKKHAAEPK